MCACVSAIQSKMLDETEQKLQVAEAQVEELKSELHIMSENIDAHQAEQAAQVQEIGRLIGEGGLLHRSEKPKFFFHDKFPLSTLHRFADACFVDSGKRTKWVQIDNPFHYCIKYVAKALRRRGFVNKVYNSPKKSEFIRIRVVRIREMKLLHGRTSRSLLHLKIPEVRHPSARFLLMTGRNKWEIVDSLSELPLTFNLTFLECGETHSVVFVFWVA